MYQTDRKRVVVLVIGYGNTGQAIAERLLAFTECDVIIGGPDEARALTLCNALSINAGSRVSALTVDATDRASLRTALQGVDLLVVAAGIPDYLEEIAKASIETNTDYLDLWYSPSKRNRFKTLAEGAKRAGRLLLTECGMQPGLPGVVVRCLAQRFETIESARVASYARADWANLTFSPSTRVELKEPFAPFVMRNGTWQDLPGERINGIDVDFGTKYGTRKCHPVFYGELADVSRLVPSLRNLDFVLDQAFGEPSPPPYFARLRGEAWGVRQGRPAHSTITIHHSDGFDLTALSVVACVRQWLPVFSRSSGLVSGGLWADAEKTIFMLLEMGVVVEYQDSLEGGEAL